MVHGYSPMHPTGITTMLRMNYGPFGFHGDSYPLKTLLAPAQNPAANNPHTADARKNVTRPYFMVLSHNRRKCAAVERFFGG